MTTAAQQHAQRNRGTLFVEDGEVISVEHFPGDQVIMRIRVPKCSAAARPGSFVHISCDDALPMRRYGRRRDAARFPISSTRRHVFDQAESHGGKL